MNWRNFLGEETYSKIVAYAKLKKMTIASVVRVAVEQFFFNKGE